jgi:DNA repair exonuclease SbcCD ATPase subunit
MKVTFKSIRWKNLLSTGNVWTEISLNKHENTLIIGDNGSGKSTLLDALCFGLYGKSFRKIRKGQLVNTINNKECEVEVEFEAAKKQYRVRRGIKPDVFEIWVDGTLLNQNRESRDYQLHLEKHILKMSMKTFSQIVIAGSRAYTPFMQLSAADRRNFIEDLLDIQVFSIMSAVNKSRLTTNKNEIDKVKIELEGKENVLKMIEMTIFRLEENNEDKIKSLTSEIQSFRKHMTMLDRDIILLKDAERDLKIILADEPKVRSKYDKMLVLKSKIATNVAQQDEHYRFYDKNCVCPTCKQDIQEDFKNEEQDRLRLRLEELEKGIDDLNKEIEKHKDLLTEFKKDQIDLQNIQTELSMKARDRLNLADQIHKNENEIKRLSSGNDSILREQKENKEKTEQEIKDIEERLKVLHEENAIMTTAADLLKDGGIKTKIIKQYVPIINKTINKYLSAMGFLVSFELDEMFDETIKSRYRDGFSYDSFSEGEKSRIDLALMLAWRAIAKTKNSTSTNLLILDEVFDGSLDDTGIEEMMKIMQGLTSDTNTFIISHKKDQMIDSFKRVLRAKKKKNFSFIEEV